MTSTAEEMWELVELAELPARQFGILSRAQSRGILVVFLEKGDDQWRVHVCECL